MFLNLSSVGGMVVGLAFVRSWKEQCLLCSNDDYEVVGSRGMLALRWIMLKDDTERDNTKRRGRIEEQRHGKMKMQSMHRVRTIGRMEREVECGHKTQLGLLPSARRSTLRSSKDSWHYFFLTHLHNNPPPPLHPR